MVFGGEEIGRRVVRRWQSEEISGGEWRISFFCVCVGQREREPMLRGGRQNRDGETERKRCVKGD